MSVFEKFFRIGVMLTIIILAINLSMLTFATPLLGGQNEASEGLGINDPLSNVDANTYTGDSEMRQTSVVDLIFISVGSINATTDFVGVAVNLVFGYIKLIDVIARCFDPVTADAIRAFGVVIIGIISIFQVIAVAYIFWAVVSGSRGGGSV